MTAGKPVADEVAIGLQVVVEVGQLPVVDGELGVRIAMRAGMRREVLRRDRHSRFLRASGEAACQCGDRGAFAMQRSIADDLGEPAIEIDAGSEAQIDADGAQLGRHEPAAGGGGPKGEIAILVIETAERSQRR